jgi:DNA-binding MarR family transcriptional regulator
MRKSYAPPDKDIINFIKKNPYCNREQLRKIFYKESIGKKKIFSSDLAKKLTKLKKHGLITESAIIRGSNGSIINSKLNVSGMTQDMKLKNEIVDSKMERSETQKFQNGKMEDISNLKDMDDKILKLLDNEKTFSNLESSLRYPQATLFRHLRRLEDAGLIIKNSNNKTWKLTSRGEGKLENLMFEKYGTEDTLFLQLPFLVQAGERFGIEDLLERTNSFYGFYYKHGLSQDDAAKDFKNKLEITLRSPLVAPYIQKIRYKYEVVCSEEKLLLWRLYSLLNTVLYKSEKNKIGFGTILYDDLIYLLKDKFGSIKEKIKDLPEYKQYWIWLLYNGAQLETILPKMEIIDVKDRDIRDELKKRGIPIKIHNDGKENETTLIEENVKK